VGWLASPCTCLWFRVAEMGMEQRVIEKAEGNGKRRGRKGFFPPIASEGDEVMESWALLRTYREAKKFAGLLHCSPIMDVGALKGPVTLQLIYFPNNKKVKFLLPIIFHPT